MGIELGGLLFLVASLGVVLNRTNLIMLLMNLEVMLLSIVVLFSTISNYYGVGQGHLFSMLVLVVAACESAIGLTIMVSYYRITGHITIKLINTLRG